MTGQTFCHLYRVLTLVLIALCFFSFRIFQMISQTLVCRHFRIDRRWQLQIRWKKFCYFSFVKLFKSS